jgi:acyl dehydratase
MSINRSCVGKLYPAASMEVTAALIEAYARACNETNLRYFAASAGAGMIAPPMFAAVVTWIPLLTALTDPALEADLIRLLHTRQAMAFFAPTRPGDVITSHARIAAVETVNAGESITIELSGANQAGEPVTRIDFTALIRARRRASARIDASGPKSITSTDAVSLTETIDLDQTLRYAEASGDRNPIHTDPSAAKLAGLQGIVVHGLCTMAFACRAIVDTVCGADPLKLRRIEVEFSRPVLPGDSITTSIWRGEPPAACPPVWAFETVNGAGVVVLRDGVAEVGAEWVKSDRS